MKIKNNYYIQRLFKENVIYILGTIVMAVLFVYLFFIFFRQYADNNQKISSEELKLEELKSRKKILEALISFDYNQVKDFNIILNKLIPNSEDYFSILYALEKLSRETGFIINSYNINLGASQPDFLSISINGDGDINSFLKLLDSYNFSSGRLITMNDFDFNNKGIQYRLSLNFYSREVPKGFVKLAEISQKDLDLMQDVRKKVEFILTSPTSSGASSDQNFDYATTQDIF